MARLLIHFDMLRTRASRSAWFKRMLAEKTTCLLGGNVVEVTEEGETAYGISSPGQVIRLGLNDLKGVREERCVCCSRILTPTYRVPVPQVEVSETDIGLLNAG